ncbi:MAG: L-rhamnose isomerase, partial [Roseinatronobacter sp.]
QLRAAEDGLDYTTRLLLQEEAHDLPYGAIWQEFCARNERPTGKALMAQLAEYARLVSPRG